MVIQFNMLSSCWIDVDIHVDFMNHVMLKPASIHLDHFMLKGQWPLLVGCAHHSFGMTPTFKECNLLRLQMFRQVSVCFVIIDDNVLYMQVLHINIHIKDTCYTWC